LKKYILALDGGGTKTDILLSPYPITEDNTVLRMTFGASTPNDVTMEKALSTLREGMETILKTASVSKEEIAAWKEKCPIKALADKMIEAGIATAEELAQIEKEAKERIDRAEEFALASPEPRVEDIFEDVYA